MSTLRDQIAVDVAANAMNTSEFAKVREVNGDPVACVLSEDVAKEHTADGVYLSEWLLSLPHDAIPLPRVGQRITVDGRRGDVIHSEVSADSLMRIRGEWSES